MPSPSSSTVVLDEALAQQVAALFSTLGDPSRVRIISVLLQGEANVSALAQAVGLSLSSVSHHLRALRQMRLVHFRKAGREVFYHLDDDHVARLFRYGVEHVEHG